MKNNGSVYEFALRIYPRILWITYDASPKLLNSIFPEGDTQEKPFVTMACNMAGAVEIVRMKEPETHGGILIRFASKNDINFDVVTHESTHAAMEVFNYIDAQVDFDNQEPFSYLCGFIAKCCSEVKSGEAIDTADKVYKHVEDKKNSKGKS